MNLPTAPTEAQLTAWRRIVRHQLDAISIADQQEVIDFMIEAFQAGVIAAASSQRKRLDVIRLAVESNSVSTAFGFIPVTDLVAP